jgi:hypothetical protein
VEQVEQVEAELGHLDGRDRDVVNPAADYARGSGKPAAPLSCSRIDGVDGLAEHLQLIDTNSVK